VIDPALSFGVAADAYDRGRPEWPSELLDDLPVAAGATVVDLGAGTGKLTRLLADRFARVIAVEPDAAMRGLIDAGEPVPGSAESIPLPDGNADAIFAAEAFHWFDWEFALPEIARVLPSGGVLALLWNRYDAEDFVLPDGIVPPSRTQKHGRFASGEWRSAFDGAPFGPFGEKVAVQEADMSRDRLIDYFASVSPVTSLSPPDREEAMQRIVEALDRDVYRRRWTAQLFWAVRS
jgi:SAM-dependent methyltransferase